MATRLLYHMQANSSGDEFYQRTISKFMKRMSFVIHRLVYVLHKREIRHFHAGTRAVDGKEMYKKARCTCKVVVLPCQTIAYLTFSSPPHLKFPIIHDTF